MDSAYLLLSEAVELVIERRNCSASEAQTALIRAGLEGRLQASGSTPLNAHRDPAVRARHPIRKSEELRAENWESEIDWNDGRVGWYFSVLIARQSIETLLGNHRHAQSEASLEQASIAEMKREIRTAYASAELAGDKPPNLKQIAKPVQAALRAKGYRASGKQIQELAGADEFKSLRRPAGKTVKSDKKVS